MLLSLNEKRYNFVIITIKFYNMTMISYVSSIPYEGLEHLVVNGYRFHWNGKFWQYIQQNIKREYSRFILII